MRRTPGKRSSRRPLELAVRVSGALSVRGESHPAPTRRSGELFSSVLIFAFAWGAAGSSGASLMNCSYAAIAAAESPAVSAVWASWSWTSGWWAGAWRASGGGDQLRRRLLEPLSAALVAGARLGALRLVERVLEAAEGAAERGRGAGSRRPAVPAAPPAWAALHLGRPGSGAAGRSPGQRVQPVRRPSGAAACTAARPRARPRVALRVVGGRQILPGGGVLRVLLRRLQRLVDRRAAAAAADAVEEVAEASPRSRRRGRRSCLRTR